MFRLMLTLGSGHGNVLYARFMRCFDDTILFIAATLDPTFYTLWMRNVGVKGTLCDHFERRLQMLIWRHY